MLQFTVLWSSQEQNESKVPDIYCVRIKLNTGGFLINIGAPWLIYLVWTLKKKKITAKFAKRNGGECLLFVQVLGFFKKKKKKPILRTK